MNRSESGGPAFPRPVSVDPTHGTLPDGDDVIREQEGMSLRDWFAGQALAGLLASTHNGRRKDESAERYMRIMAIGAYDFADAMIRERSPRHAPRAQTSNFEEDDWPGVGGSSPGPDRSGDADHAQAGENQHRSTPEGSAEK